MAMKSERWQTITTSQYSWEQHGLDYVRAGLPDHEPYRAWSNFEFQASNGALYEVDLLVLSKTGFYLVELKNRRGTVRGDAGTWTWTTNDGKLFSEDNPYALANRKAKSLAGLLSSQSALRGSRLPFLGALVFLYSVTDELTSDLRGPSKARVCLKDELEPNGAGILAAVKGGAYQGAPRTVASVDARLARRISQAMDEAGIRRTQKYRRVGDYVLEKLLFEGPDFQDRLARHSSVKKLERRVRLYPLERVATEERRQRARRAALREFQLLQGIAHPGIVAVHDFKEHELGPALIFDYDPNAQRLDHYLIAKQGRLTAQQRISLVRQLAEAVQYMHGRRIVHRGLSPESILVTQPSAKLPRLKIFNWQTGFREGATSGTTHLQDLVEQRSMVYLAPEAISTPGEAGELCDVFSLGAVAWHIFAEKPPANSHVELYEKLSRDRGLRLSSVVDGSPASLDTLIQRSTHPDVFSRIDTVASFLELLEQVESEISAPEGRTLVNPLDPQARPGDDLGHDFTFIRRLGEGSTALAVLAKRDEKQFVLKIALCAEHNERLEAEAEALRKVHHAYIVALFDVLTFSDRKALVLSKAGDKTLATRLREDGPLSIDLLQRFGEDLLSALQTLEEHGIAHRDIKPDNLGVAAVGRGDALHLVLYDFSLTRASADQILVGTRAYRDPFLPLRRPPRWDFSAERYSAGVTLYEMATGLLPVWGDGQSDAALVECELKMEAHAFEPPELRPPLTSFFLRALHRDSKQRFDNAEEMKRAWSRVFDDVDARSSAEETEDEANGQARRAALASATLETWIAELGLGTRARHALERAGVNTVQALLSTPPKDLQFMRGVGKKTRDELLDVSARLRERFPRVKVAAPRPSEVLGPQGAEASKLNIDHLFELVLGPRPSGAGKKRWENRRLYLGLGDDREARPGTAPASFASTGPLIQWPTQADLAEDLKVTRANVSAHLGRDRRDWRRIPALLALREQIIELVENLGGVATAAELCTAVLATRGSVQEDAFHRFRQTSAVTRAALELELVEDDPRLFLRRTEGPLLVMRTLELEDYTLRLGREADRLVEEDPLPSPARALEVLQAVPGPEGFSVRTDRLVRLAASASRSAAVSVRLELYPRGMEAERALPMAVGSLVGLEELTLELLRERVLGRYPEAESLPARPELDQLLDASGLSLRWDPAAQGGVGAFRRPMRPGVTLSTRVESGSTGPGDSPRPPADPKVSNARDFDEMLQHARQEGGFLVLTLRQKHLYEAERLLQERFGLERVSLDELLIDGLKAEAARYEVDWSVILEADGAPPGSYDHDNLQGLVTEVVHRVEARLFAKEDPLLLVDPGLLARYDRMDVLEKLRDQAGRTGRLPLCWVLVPTDEQQAQPMMDQKVIPLLTTAQRARVPGAWLESVNTLSNLMDWSSPK